MKIQMTHIKIASISLTLVTLLLACEKRTSPKSGSSSLMSLNTTSLGDVAEGSDPSKLCSYLKSNGYFPSNSYPANTKLLFSSSYEIVENSAGQGYGIIGADGYFVQQGNTTTQMLVCPGASNMSGGKCAWKINGDDGYAQLAYDVVCNKKSRGGESIHPGYSQQSAKKVSYQAETAGQKANGADAVEVTLEGRSSKARILFAKNVGLVAVVFQESASPAGTSEVFIGGSGSDMMGNGSN